MIITLSEGEPLEYAGDILLIARQAIERLGQDDIEAPFAGILHERLDIWLQETGA